MRNFRKIFFTLLFGIAMMLMLSMHATKNTPAKNIKPFTLTLPGFMNGISFKKENINKNTGGKNVSPALSWKNAPEGTKSFALTCIDTNPVANRWVHWMILNIPANVSSIPENASLKKMPSECIELNNSFGYKGYGGPQPPPNTGVHRYVFTLYALDINKLTLPEKFLSEQNFLRLIKNKTLSKSTFTLTYLR